MDNIVKLIYWCEWKIC